VGDISACCFSCAGKFYYARILEGRRCEYENDGNGEFYEKLGPYLPYLGIKRINYGDGASQITRDNSEGIFCLGKKIEGSYHCMFYEEK